MLEWGRIAGDREAMSFFRRSETAATSAAHVSCSGGLRPPVPSTVFLKLCREFSRLSARKTKTQDKGTRQRIRACLCPYSSSPIFVSRTQPRRRLRGTERWNHWGTENPSHFFGGQRPPLQGLRTSPVAAVSDRRSGRRQTRGLRRPRQHRRRTGITRVFYGPFGDALGRRQKRKECGSVGVWENANLELGTHEQRLILPDFMSFK